MKKRTIFITLIIVTLLLLGIKRDSLWIDEAETANYALQPTFAAWKHVLMSDREANCQFPVYMLSIWSWEKIVGPSEYALRSVNALFALLLFLSFYLIGKELKFKYLWGIILIQPFFWYYLNEARPYILQMGSGSLLLAGLVLLINNRRVSLGWWLFILGTISLYYSTLLSFITIISYYLLLFVLLHRGIIRLPKNWIYIAVLLAVLLAPGAIYYLSTVLRGAEGARFWSVSPVNLMWLYYEFIGAIGLGPAVFEIRDIGHNLLHAGISPVVLLSRFAAAGLLCVAICLFFAVSLIKHKKKIFSLNLYSSVSLIFIINFVIFIIISVLLHKAFWARHLVSIFPIYCLLFYKLLSKAFYQIKNHKLFTIIAILNVGMLLLSIFHYYYSAKYERDDNRGAATLVKESIKKGKTVWWVAASQCARYYGLPLKQETSLSDQLQVLYSPDTKNISSLQSPDLIILNNRYDIFDDNNSIRNYVVTNNYKATREKLQAFSVWEK